MRIMPSSGLFVTLYDEETLNLYLREGIYGFLMPPVDNAVPQRSRHYQALADYACARDGTHVFFFRKRMIVYGGQVRGSNDVGSFYLNGQFSPLGRAAKADVYWDEGTREKYVQKEEPGIFEVPEIGIRCQPYLLKFEDLEELRGSAILSDQLYFKLGRYPYPLPSNSISNMSFCTLTPGEVEAAITLFSEEPKKRFSGESQEDISLAGRPIPFNSSFGVSSLIEAFEDSLFVNEAHMEASVIANPNLLPDEVRPKRATICRQVPVSPFKPAQMDRADICYFTEDKIQNGTVPNTIIELKVKPAGKPAVEQIRRYLDWLHLVLRQEDAKRVMVYLLAPSFAGTARVPIEYSDQMRLISLL
jgi:hypothetical protein